LHSPLALAGAEPFALPVLAPLCALKSGGLITAGGVAAPVWRKVLLARDGFAAFHAFKDDEGDGIMAKKRKVARNRKTAKAKASVKRKAPVQRKRAGGEVDPINVVAVVLVLVLIGLGIFFYQASHKTADTASTTPPAAQMEKK
jgi:hypothetical protein